MSHVKSPVVFLGPTMPAGEASRLLEAVYLPPAGRGAVVAAAQRYRPAAILLIDGVFGTEPAVRHAEILWAMSHGVPVIGAASMGALRAAELGAHGMMGVGLIYRWYRRHALAPDDAVAVLHAPTELGCFPLTHALVDIRMSVRRAERASALDNGLRVRLERAAIALNFRERSLEAVITAAIAGETSDRHEAVQAALERAWVPQKAHDTAKALRFLALPDALSHWAPPRRPFVKTASFVRDMAEVGLDMA